MNIWEWEGCSGSAGSGVRKVGDGRRDRSLGESCWGRGSRGMWKGMEDVGRVITASYQSAYTCFFQAH